jgi:RNA recognition motif-containing protein
MTESGVRELFSKQGPVTEVKLMIDASTGNSRGKAFVTMASPEVAQTALKSLHTQNFGGRSIAVTEARPTPEVVTGLIGHGFETGISSIRPASGQKNNGQHNGKKSGGYSKGRSRRPRR